MLQSEAKPRQRPRYNEIAKTLFAAIQARHDAEKVETSIALFFKAEIPGGGTVRAGRYIISVIPKTKTSIDIERLMALIGAEGVRQLEKKTPYLEVGVIEAQDMGLTH